MAAERGFVLDEQALGDGSLAAGRPQALDDPPLPRDTPFTLLDVAAHHRDLVFTLHGPHANATAP